MADEDKRPEGAEKEESPAEGTSQSADAAAQGGEKLEGAEKPSSEGETQAESVERNADEASPRSAGADNGHGHGVSEEHGHGAGEHHGAGADHGLSHTTTVQLLVGVFAALTVLTIATVAVTSVDLGGQGNFIVAMVIATIKAALVMAFFMHMLWDNKFNVVVFVSSFLFVVLFLGFALTDRSEYQRSIDLWETAAADAG